MPRAVGPSRAGAVRAGARDIVAARCARPPRALDSEAPRDENRRMTTPPLPPALRSSRVAQTVRYVLDPVRLFDDAQRRLGDVFVMRVLDQTWVVLTHPDHVREVFAHGPDDLDSGLANISR